MSTTPIDYDALAKQAGALSSQPSPSGTPAAGIDYDALAKQAGAISSQSSSQTQSAPPADYLTKTEDLIGKLPDVAAGFAKGVGDTVSGVSHLINKIPVIGETLAPSSGIAALDQMDASKNTAQSVGKGIEGIAEFAAGDEALEGVAKASKLVALGQKYPLIAKTLQLATEHPWLAKIITEGTKGAVVGGVQGVVKGAQQNNTGRGAAVGVSGGAVAGPVMAGVGTLVGPAGELIANPFRAARAVGGAVADTVGGIADKFMGSDIQPMLKSGIQDVWNSVADNAGVARPTAASVQDLGEQVGDSILARSKSSYQAIDTATGGRFSGTEQALRSVNQDLRSVTNDTEEQALLVRKTRLELQMNQMLDTAESQGVPKSTVDAAKSDFKQAQAIYDTNHQIQMSTTGVRPGMQGSTDVPEAVNAKSLMNRLNKLYNSGRLQQAVGDDGAEDLIGHSATAQKAARNVVRNVRNAKVVGGVVGVPAVGTAVVEGVRKALE